MPPTASSSSSSSSVQSREKISRRSVNTSSQILPTYIRASSSITVVTTPILRDKEKQGSATAKIFPSTSAVNNIAPRPWSTSSERRVAFSPPLISSPQKNSDQSVDSAKIAPFSDFIASNGGSDVSESLTRKTDVAGGGVVAPYYTSFSSLTGDHSRPDDIAKFRGIEELSHSTLRAARQNSNSSRKSTSVMNSCSITTVNILPAAIRTPATAPVNKRSISNKKRSPNNDSGDVIAESRQLSFSTRSENKATKFATLENRDDNAFVVSGSGVVGEETGNKCSERRENQVPCCDDGMNNKENSTQDLDQNINQKHVKNFFNEPPECEQIMKPPSFQLSLPTLMTASYNLQKQDQRRPPPPLGTSHQKRLELLGIVLPKLPPLAVPSRQSTMMTQKCALETKYFAESRKYKLAITDRPTANVTSWGTRFPQPFLHYKSDDTITQVGRMFGEHSGNTDRSRLYYGLGETVSRTPGFRVLQSDGRVGFELAPMAALGWLDRIGGRVRHAYNQKPRVNFGAGPRCKEGHVLGHRK